MLQYLGGKASMRSTILPIIAKYRKKGQPYLEPFVGMGAIVLAMDPKDGPRYVNDYDEDVCVFWKAAQRGWIPPKKVPTRETWLRYKHQKGKPSAIRTFYGLAITFGGGKYAAYYPPNFATSRKRYMRNYKKTKGIHVSCKSYDQLHPRGMVIFADPPYKGTTNKYYKSGDRFDHVHFWNVMRRWSKNNTVIVSSLKAPKDFIVVATKRVHLRIRPRGQGPGVFRTEKVFMHKNGWVKK